MSNSKVISIADWKANNGETRTRVASTAKRLDVFSGLTKESRDAVVGIAGALDIDVREAINLILEEVGKEVTRGEESNMGPALWARVEGAA